jgi:hypothetical protein
MRLYTVLALPCRAASIKRRAVMATCQHTSEELSMLVMTRRVIIMREQLNVKATFRPSDEKQFN